LLVKAPPAAAVGDRGGEPVTRHGVT